MAIAVFKSKIGRDAFLAEVRQRGLWAWGLRVSVRPQVPRYLRESQQLLRCVMRCYSDTTKSRDQMRPEWD
eukprot:9221019-Alexandrium_andersonii.AAC.1